MSGEAGIANNAGVSVSCFGDVSVWNLILDDEQFGFLVLMPSDARSAGCIIRETN